MSIVFRFPLVLVLCFQCSLALGGSLDKENTSTAIEDVKQLQNQHKKEAEELLSRLTREEREWYEKFQNGLMLFSGWKEISQDILSELPADEQPSFEELLEDMGARIGAEWSKDNDIRRIDTDQLRSWGDQLREASKKDPPSLTQTVMAISTEVDQLLSRPRSSEISNL